MYQTTRGMLENFLSLIDRFGFIPNGGRIYYLARSQPPLLSGMIKSYVDHTHDYNFAIHSIELLVREFEYFMTNKTVIVKGHRLARYIDFSSGEHFYLIILKTEIECFLLQDRDQSLTEKM